MELSPAVAFLLTAVPLPAWTPLLITILVAVLSLDVVLLFAMVLSPGTVAAQRAIAGQGAVINCSTPGIVTAVLWPLLLVIYSSDHG